MPGPEADTGPYRLLSLRSGMKLSLDIISDTNETLFSAQGTGFLQFDMLNTPFRLGDRFVITSSDKITELEILLDTSLGVSRVLLTDGHLEFPIPFDKRRRAYPPAAVSAFREAPRGVPASRLRRQPAMGVYPRTRPSRAPQLPQPLPQHIRPTRANLGIPACIDQLGHGRRAVHGAQRHRRRHPDPPAW